MTRRTRRIAWLSFGLLLAVVACGASGNNPAAPVDAGAAVPDPGGPFMTSVAPDAPLASLDLIEGDILCRDLTAAFYGFLDGAVEQDTLCRQSAGETAADVTFGLDGGSDAAGICTSLYGPCVENNLLISPFFCPFPDPSNMPCTATVSDLSACLNEIASFDPVDACVKVPACDGGLVDAAAPSPASLPACERLNRICPLAAQVAHFPC